VEFTDLSRGVFEITGKILLRVIVFDLKAEAAIIYYHSPYPEVRSVTEPFDNLYKPVKTIRAYFLRLVWMAGSTALNTFFSPR
jgi:hypothetical protein